ncbi:MAG: efflux RND transporter periplasmic adaptor subunit [Anaerolineales bacterium]|nr:efflux RND transporter periplasmic adaptor subunit [Anaerolineales bacterium]
MTKTRIFIGIAVVIILVVLGLWIYWSYLAPPAEQPVSQVQAEVEEALPGLVSAEGQVVSLNQVSLAFTQAGRVEAILVSVGDSVEQGQVLAKLETDTLDAAVKQAETSLALAQANLQAARTGLERAHYAAHLQDAPSRTRSWQEDWPSEIDQPVWYFDKAQETASAQKELESARSALATEQANLQSVLEKTTSADLLAAEARLADAQAAFLVADDVLERAKKSPDDEIEDQAQANYDRAESELEAAQTHYDQILTTQGAEDVSEARARLAVAQERYDTALDRLYALQTADQSWDVKIAQESVQQAEAAAAQAQAALDAARVALDQAVLTAPVNGVVVMLDIEIGEMASPGVAYLQLMDLTAWQVETIDLAEVDVALIRVGLPARITLDAFPGQVFPGVIREISHLGEDRRGDVTYTVTVDFTPGDVPVRSGMTAFVEVDLP